jgi:two-component system alkaline phosphatase synthesis response regulator PhoP
VTAVSDGIRAVKAFKQERFNLIILDVMLPEMDGYRVCETIRLDNTDVPILFLTAKNTSEDRVMGLKKGADDYLTKPFNLEELLLRVQILIKRSVQIADSGRSIDTYRIADKEINFTTYELFFSDGSKTELTKKETLLLKLLIERKNEVVSRENILESVWGYDVYPSTRTIDNFILSFRKYFEENPREPKHFHSIRGVGYKYTD